MNQHIFIVLILFALVTVEKVSAFALKRLIDQNRNGPSQLHSVYSLRYQTTRNPFELGNQPEHQRMYRTTQNPYRFHYQPPSQRMYRTTPGPFNIRYQQKPVTIYSNQTFGYGGYGQGRFITRVTPNPNTPYGSYNQGRVTRNYGYGYRYPAATERPYWYKPNSGYNEYGYRSTNSPYGYRPYYYGGWTTQRPHYGSNWGSHPLVTQSPYWGLRKDITTNNDHSEYSDDIDENNLSGEYYNGDD